MTSNLDLNSTNLKITMQSESVPHAMDNFDEILDQLRETHGKPLTDTSSFFITAALLTLATELAGVRELMGVLSRRRHDYSIQRPG
jgi:hypothetical protein